MRTRKPNPLEQLRIGTRMLVAARRQAGESDDVIRTRVMDAIKEGIEGVSSVTSTMQIGDRVETLVNSAGIFRLVLVQPGLARKDQWAQETWLETVREELEQSLGRTDGDHARRLSINPK